MLSFIIFFGNFDTPGELLSIGKYPPKVGFWVWVWVLYPYSYPYPKPNYFGFSKFFLRIKSAKYQLKVKKYIVYFLINYFATTQTPLLVFLGFFECNKTLQNSTFISHILKLEYLQVKIKLSK